ncbi:hypothetical protein KAR28_01665 [Candidatus Parcubacteria bacterium]|nr:hypothetical protein [Candidatus Parcubacteria bacterium]
MTKSAEKEKKVEIKCNVCGKIAMVEETNEHLLVMPLHSFGEMGQMCKGSGLSAYRTVSQIKILDEGY